MSKNYIPMLVIGVDVYDVVTKPWRGSSNDIEQYAADNALLYFYDENLIGLEVQVEGGVLCADIQEKILEVATKLHKITGVYGKVYVLNFAY